MATFFSHNSAQANGFSVLHSFAGFPSDGQEPFAGLIADSNGNMYGTTIGGGINLGYDSIYKIAPDGTETILYSFQPTGDGGDPEGRLLLLNGDLYGTTVLGGDANVGTVFKLGADGKESVLYKFCKGWKSGTCLDGAYPETGLIADASGNLYGTTVYGGPYGGGVVFRIAPNGTYSRLHAFCLRSQCSDGAYSFAELTLDGAGNLYGTTGNGGSTAGCVDTGCGVVFRITPSGSYKVLYTFKGKSDGANPQGGLVQDAAGNLYGTTFAGGIVGCAAGCGTIYKLAPDGTETMLYAFKGGVDGVGPIGQLARDDSGNLYGTTTGTLDQYGFGTVFRLDTSAKEKVLHVFCIDDGYCLHGIQPTAGLLLQQNVFYGTTAFGGPVGSGVVFQLPKK